MEWVRTERGYLINPGAVESIGIGKKEVTKYVPTKRQFPETINEYVYVVRVRTVSGTTYDVSTHTLKEEAQSIMEEIYEKLKEVSCERL
ncbi:hypothetical protein [Desulfurobacterium indicum]|uniref:Uncharacterized protein n=1 Tax=Desulfurobacterium indicum TaxID=1914305 RepID=A0A1R1MJD5_9BACT|nr:hypothetical protein [Desulfurobacterium indicum]OMH39932.1 hypothetical protein BLW93_07860 [Desulfurobacterium indicum]